MAWWIKKKKKVCKCPCHWSALQATFNPQDTHCDVCTEQLRAARKLKKLDGNHQRKKIIKQLDEITSLIVRIRANWTCAKCRRKYPPQMGAKGLPAQNIMTCSHFFGRTGSGVRWDYDNLDALCIFCHQKVENHKKDWIEGFHYEQYMKTKLGEDRFNLLDYRANTTTKYTLFDLQFMLSERQKELQPLLIQYA